MLPSGHILFEEDMLSQEGIMLPDISSLKSTCSVKKGICSGHILFEEDMLSQAGICSQTYPL
jgi:hypothetical protein